MKKFLISALILLCCSTCFANDLSKQATAFYSDNNHIRTMDLILQINEKERSAQDWLLLGNVLADNGKQEDALFMYQKAIAKDKKCYKAYFNIGNYYLDKGQYDNAIDNYSKAIKINSENPYIYYNLGCAYLRKENLPSARLNFYKAIMFNSNVPEFHYNLAYTYHKMNKDKLAKTYIDNYNKLTQNP